MSKKSLPTIVILLSVLFFSFGYVSAAVCDDCCKSSDCGSGGTFDCVGAGSLCTTETREVNNETVTVFKGEVGQCQPAGSVAFCPFSKHRKIEDLIDAVSKWIFILALVIAPLMILLGGFYMLTAAGDPGRSNKGKQIILWAVIGLGVILFAKAFISIIKFVLK